MPKQGEGGIFEFGNGTRIHRDQMPADYGMSPLPPSPFGQGGVNVPNYYAGGNYKSKDYFGSVKGAGSGMYNNVSLPKSGSHYFGGMILPGSGQSYFGKVPELAGGASYFKGMPMMKGGDHYFNDGTVDLVDKAGDYAGLEAEASRLLSRSGGALAAQMGMSGMNGGLANIAQSALTSGVMGGLAKDINADKYQRQVAVQQGTLDIAQGKMAGDQALAALEMEKRSAIMQGDYNRVSMIQRKQEAIANADATRSGLDLSRRQGMLSADTARSQTQLGVANGRANIAMHNSNISLQKAQGRTQNSQFNANLGATIANNKTNAWLAGEQLQNNRLGMGLGAIRDPNYGYVDPYTGRADPGTQSSGVVFDPFGTGYNVWDKGGGPFGWW